MTTSIFACRDLRSPHWRLGHLPPSRGALVAFGWRVEPPAVDAGVPEAVADILARAFTSAGRLTFLCSTVPPDVGKDDQTVVCRDLESRGLLSGLKSLAGMADRNLTLLSTRRAETARGLFADPVYPWWLQGQFAILSPFDDTPPTLDNHLAGELLSDNWIEQAHLPGANTLAVLRPGVDGDIAGMLFLKRESEEQILRTIEAECRSTDLSWDMLLTEDSFADRLAG